MIREAKAIGCLAILRAPTGEFSEKEISLASTFADQAVIAIENVRLFNETKEALEQQTATAEVLKVISESPTDVQPVFEAIAERAATLCGARIGVVTRFDGEFVHLQAFHGASPEATQAIRATYPLKPGAGTVTARAIRDRAPAQIVDVLADAEYAQKDASQLAGFRSNLAVPMFREGHVVGAISVARAETGPFPEKQIRLLQTFADQAVIAIENVRLFNETKEALEQQTATAEILKVISESPTEVQPVFEAIVRAGARLFDGAAVAVTQPEGGQIRLMASADFDPQRAAQWRDIFPFPLERDYIHGAALLDGRIVDVADVLHDDGEFKAGKHNAAPSGYRAFTVVPMMRGAQAIGTVTVMRPDPGPLADKQVALLKTFADQAVIAIENVRLFNETKEALEQQTRVRRDPVRDQQLDYRHEAGVRRDCCASCQRLFAGDTVGVTLIREDGLLDVSARWTRLRAREPRSFPSRCP